MQIWLKKSYPHLVFLSAMLCALILLTQSPRKNQPPSQFETVLGQWFLIQESLVEAEADFQKEVAKQDLILEPIVEQFKKNPSGMKRAYLSAIKKRQQQLEIIEQPILDRVGEALLLEGHILFEMAIDLQKFCTSLPKTQLKQFWTTACPPTPIDDGLALGKGFNKPLEYLLAQAKWRPLLTLAGNDKTAQCMTLHIRPIVRFPNQNGNLILGQRWYVSAQKFTKQPVEFVGLDIMLCTPHSVSHVGIRHDDTKPDDFFMEYYHISQYHREKPTLREARMARLKEFFGDRYVTVCLLQEGNQSSKKDGFIILE